MPQNIWNYEAKTPKGLPYKLTVTRSGDDGWAKRVYLESMLPEEKYRLHKHYLSEDDDCDECGHSLGRHIEAEGTEDKCSFDNTEDNMPEGVGQCRCTGFTIDDDGFFDDYLQDDAFVAREMETVWFIVTVEDPKGNRFDTMVAPEWGLAEGAVNDTITAIERDNPPKAFTTEYVPPNTTVVSDMWLVTDRGTGYVREFSAAVGGTIPQEMMEHLKQRYMADPPKVEPRLPDDPKVMAGKIAGFVTSSIRWDGALESGVTWEEMVQEVADMIERWKKQ